MGWFVREFAGAAFGGGALGGWAGFWLRCRFGCGFTRAQA